MTNMAVHFGQNQKRSGQDNFSSLGRHLDCRQKRSGKNSVSPPPPQHFCTCSTVANGNKWGPGVSDTSWICMEESWHELVLKITEAKRVWNVYCRVRGGASPKWARSQEQGTFLISCDLHGRPSCCVWPPPVGLGRTYVDEERAKNCWTANSGEEWRGENNNTQRNMQFARQIRTYTWTRARMHRHSRSKLWRSWFSS